MSFRSLAVRLIKKVVLGTGIVGLVACSMNQVGLGAKVDITPPKLAITSPTADGQYKSGTIHLVGTVSDDIGVKAVIVVFPSGTGDVSRSAAVSGTGWSLDLTTGAGGDLIEGAATINVSAADASGKVVTVSRLVYVDNTKPTVLLDSPASYDAATPANAPLFSDYIDIKGQVFDASPVTSVVVTLYRGNTSTVLGSPKTADGTSTFSTRFFLKQAGAHVADGLLGPGDDGHVFSYSVTATDAAGNTNTWSFHRQDIYSAMTASAVPAGTLFPTVNELGGLDSAGTGTSASGITWTSLNAVRKLLTPPTYNFSFVYTAMPSIRFVNIDPASGTNILGVNAQISGTIQPPPASGSTVVINSVVSKVYATSDLVTPIITETGATANQDLRVVGDSLSYALALKQGGSVLPPGSYRLVLSAQAVGSSVASISADFYIDTGAPFLDLSTSSSSSQYVNSGLTLGGVASSPTGLNKIDLYQSINGVPTPPSSPNPVPVETLTLSGTSSTWTSVTLPTDLNVEGSYDLTATLTTTSGKTTSVYRTFTYDKTAPTTSVNSVTPLIGTAISGTSASFSLGASDVNGVTEVRWALLSRAASAPTWAAVPGLSAPHGAMTAPPYVVANFDTTALAEGSVTLWVLAIDKAGNVGINHKDLEIDQNPPTLAIAAPAAAPSPFVVTAASAAGFTGFSGTAADSNALAGLTVSVDGAAATAVTVTAGSWSYPYPINAATHAQDGAHSFVFVATDTSGRTATASRSLAVDTTAPSTTVTQPANLVASNPAYWLSGSTATLGGTASDSGTGASGLASVYFLVAPKGSSHGADVPSATWTLAAGSSTWSTTINLGALGEGQFTLWTAAYDNAGNVSSFTQRDFGVDQANPTLTALGAPVYTKTAFTLFGSLADTNALSSLAITESKNFGAAAAVSFTPSVTLLGATSATYSTSSLPLGGVTEGSYAYVVTVTDASGKTTTVNRTVVIDQTAPTVNFNGVPTWVLSSIVTLSGTANDLAAGASGLATIQYQLDAGGWVSANWTDTSGGTNTTGTWNATVFGLTEGSHTVSVRGTDAAGNTATLAAVPFGVDLNPPALTLAATPATVTAATAAGFTGFTGTVYDTNPAAVAALTLTSTQNGSAVSTNAPVSYPGTSNVAGNPWTSSLSIDSGGHTTDGLWSFTFLATDAAGKTAQVTRAITIDTQSPTTTVTAPSANGWVSSTTLATTGVATDGTGTGVNAVWIKADNLYVASSGTDHSTETPSAGAGWTLATGKTNWSGSVTLSGEGRKTLWVKAYDTAGNLTTAAEAVSARVDFGLDLHPPVVAQTDAVPSLVNSSFTLTGTTSDTNSTAPPTLTVAVDGGSATAVSVTSGAWTYPVSSLPADGTHTYLFTSTDVAGKTATLTRTLGVDTTVPTTTVLQPGNYLTSNPLYWLSGSTSSFAGSASDTGTGASGVAKVWYKVDTKGVPHGADVPSASWVQAAGTTNWSTTVNLVALGEGSFTLWTAAYDNAGNLAAFVQRDFGVDQSAPTLSETSHAAVSSSKAAFTLTGVLGDTNALASLTITESKNAAAPVAVTFTPTVTVAGATSAGYTSASLPLGGVVDGSYAYVITATDAAGKTTTVNRTVTIDTTAPTVGLTAIPAWVASTATSISGTATDPNAGASGVASVQVQVDGGSWTNASWVDTSGGANTAGTWSLTLTGLAEGSHTVSVKSVDAASNTSSLSNSAFGVDLNPPALTETTLGTTSLITRKTGFTLTGAVTDTNPVSVGGSTLTVSVSLNGAAGVSASVTGATWSYAPSLTDGTYSIAITATDAAGKTTTVNRLVLLDTTAPTLTLNTPAAGAWVSSTSLSLSGSAQDGAGSGLNKIYYVVDDLSNDHSTDVATWTATSGASAPVSSTSATWSSVSGLLGNWSGTANLIGEGSKRLWVVAADKAGNTTAISGVLAPALTNGTTYTIGSLGTTDFTGVGASSNTVGLSFVATGPGTGTGSAWTGNGVVSPLGLDLNPPSLAETLIATPSKVIMNASAGFSGTASDTNPAGAPTLSVSVDGAAGQAISVAAGSWSWTYVANPTTHAQDGTHTFVFTATDVAGKTTVVTRSVQIDTDPATALITAPGSGSWTGITPSTVQGTASDGSGAGVAEVWTLVDLSTNDHTSDPTAPVALTTGGVWQKATGTTNWSASWALGTEGSKKLWVAVKDVAGNWNPAALARSFGFDSTPPLLGLSALGGYNTAPVLSGTASDGTGSGVSSIKVKIDSGAFQTVTLASSWTFDTAVPADLFTPLSQGSHTVTVLATDAAGNQTTQTGSFNKDTTAPVLSFNNIAAGGGTVVQDTNPIITGALADPSGVSAASYTLLVWNPSLSSGAGGWSTIATAISLGSPAGTTNWNWSLDLSSAGLDLPDGKYSLAITGADAVQPSANSATSSGTVFMLSRTSPVVTVVQPTLGTFQSGTFTLSGTVADPTGITAVITKPASGSVNFGSGTTAAIPALPVTAAPGTPGIFTTSALHSLVAGDPVVFWGTTLPVIPGGSIVAGTTYYVKTVTSPTSFTLSATNGGTALDINSSFGTGMVVAATKYSFASFHPVTPVSISGSVLTANNHNLTAGDVVYFQGAALPTPTAAATAYFVVNATANTLQVSATLGGAALTLTSSGSNVSLWSSTQGLKWMVPNLSVSGFSDGPLTAFVQASAGSGKSNQGSRDFTLDATAPVISVTSPSSGTRSVGNLTLVGGTTDPGSVPSGVTGTIQYQIGKNYNLGNASSWTNANVTGGAYSWTISLGDMSIYANATYATLSDVNGNTITPSSASISGNIVTVPGQTYTDGTVVYFGGSPLPQFGGSTISPNTAYYATNIAGNTFQISSTWPTKTLQTVTNPGTSLTVSTVPPLWKLPIVFQATDKAANVGQKSDYFLILDPNGNIPVVTITQPAGGLTLGGQQRITGTASQPVWVHDVEVSVDPTNTGTFTTWVPATLVSTGNTVIWYYDINVGGVFPQSGSSQTVQVEARAWNSPTTAGSRGTISGLLTAPLTMTFDSTFPKVQNIQVNGAGYYSQITTRGTVTVTAQVSSSKGISKIEAVESSPLSGSTAVYDTGSSYGLTNASKSPYWNSTVTPPSSKTSGTYSGGNTKRVLITAVGSNPSLWINAGATDSTVGKSFVPTSSLDVSAAGGSFLESDNTGNFIYSLSMTMDSSQLYNNATGQYSFDLRATDMGSPAGVSSSNVLLNEDNYYATSSQVIPGVVTAGNFVTGQRYVINAVADTDFTLVGSPRNAVGQTFVATGAGTGAGTVLQVLVGSTQKLQGSASDVGAGSGSLGGLAKVVVYLTRSNQLLNMKTGSGTSAGVSQAVKNFSNGGALESVVYPDTSAYSAYFASIDTIAENGSGDTNGDGFVESFQINGNARDWWAQFDTTVLSDGPLVIHTVVWDIAGNASHYQQAAFLSNHAPVLGNVDIGIDLNGDGTIDGSETNTGVANASLNASGITVRNSRLSFKVNLSQAPVSGNTPTYYSLQYNGREYNGSRLAAGSMTSGQTYVIDSVGTTNWMSLGSPDVAKGTVFTYNGAVVTGGGGFAVLQSSLTGSTITITDFSAIPDSASANDRIFTLTVYDSANGTTAGLDSQSFIQTIGLTVKNIDAVVPAVSTRSPYWNSASDNSLYQNSATNGHIDLGIPTGATGNLNDSDPKVSGKIRLEGTLSDDQRVQFVRMRIASASGGFDFAGGTSYGTWTTVAQWNSGTKTLVGVDQFATNGWKFTVSSETLTSSGHSANWTLEWDTARVKNGADTNLVATIEVQDFRNSGTNAQGTANFTQSSVQLDVVPYLRDITRSAPFTNRLSDNAMNSGKAGFYPLYQGITGVVITGFNLPSSTVQDASNWIKVGATSLTLTAAVGTRDSLTATIPASLTTAGGGTNADLTVTTNALGSINNTNSNAASYNTAAEGSFTDDRKVYVDELAPSIAIAPFGSTYTVQATDDTTNGLKSVTSVSDYTDNVPYTGGDKTIKANWLGHVEYAADNTVTSNQAALSGQVTFKGKASDNQRIFKITATIGNATTGFDGGTGVGGEFTIYTLAGGFASGTGWAAAADGTNYVIDSSRVDKGHVLNWNFTWDTSKLNKVAATSVVIQFKVYDANSTSQTATDTQTVDIVPYIQSITTPLSAFYTAAPSVFDRTSKLGNYPVAESTTIAVKGFNFTGATTTINGTSVTPSISNSRNMTVPVGTTASSGALVVTVNAVSSTNNANNNGQTWNQLHNGVNNNLLNDDVNLDIWKFTTVTTPKGGSIGNVNMKVSPSGKIGFSFQNAVVFFNMPGLDSTGAFRSQTTFDENYGWFTSNNFAWDAQDNTYALALCPDTGGSIGQSANLIFYSRKANKAINSMGLNENYNGGVNKRRIENTSLSFWNGASGTTVTDIFRFVSPDLVTTMPTPASAADDAANKVNVYMAYYDDLTQQIRYRWGQVGSAPDNIGTTLTDLGTLGTQLPAPPVDSWQNNYQVVASNSVNASYPLYNTASTVQPGKYVAIGVDRNAPTNGNSDVVTLAWYNAIDGKLYFSYNTNPQDTNSQTVTAGSFQTGTNYVITSVGTTSFTGIGASSNTVGISFKATGVGAGTGTATVVGNRIAATAMVAGQTYTIATVGTTSFTGVGAPSNTVGVSFKATAAGTGTGFVWTTQPSSSVSQWQSHAVVVDTVKGGWFVKMAVDSSHGIHLAYYTSAGGDLKYAYLTNYLDTSPKVAVVDSFLSVGTNCTIDVGKDASGNQVPYISYFTAANSGTQASAKMAYRTDFSSNVTGAFDGADATSYFTGKWEITTVPTNNTPIDGQVNVGMYKNASGVITAIPTGSFQSFAETNSFPVSNSSVVVGNGSLNPVVGYAVQENGILEMGQKK